MTSQQIKEAAKCMGTDIVGIGSIDRWEDAPIQMDPRQIMPKVKSIIAMGFRVLRGSLRGVEEGIAADQPAPYTAPYEKAAMDMDDAD